MTKPNPAAAPSEDPAALRELTDDEIAAVSGGLPNGTWSDLPADATATRPDAPNNNW